MSRRVGTPQNRIELSSVSVVKLKKKSSTFEVAAYPSKKVKDFRAGVEADVDEVLQVARVFTNTVHGVVAPKKQLQKHFPGLSIEQICEEILKKGSLQVSAKEREAETDKLMAEVTNLVASMYRRRHGRAVGAGRRRAFTERRRWLRSIHDKEREAPGFGRHEGAGTGPRAEARAHGASGRLWSCGAFESCGGAASRR